MDTAPPHILVVGPGSVGGIGRFEHLLLAALRELTARQHLRFTSIRRRSHPAYLHLADTDSPPRSGPDSTETSMPAFLVEIARVILRTRPDLVLFLHVNLARAAPIARVLGVRRYAVATYGVEVWSPLDPFRRKALLAASRVWTISEYTSGQLVKRQGLPERSISVVPLALEPRWLDDAADAPTPHTDSRPARKDRPRMLSVSRLASDALGKGIHDVIRAIPAARSVLPAMTYHVVGDGTGRRSLERLAESCGVSDVVVFRGLVSHDELVEEYRQADLFVLPSRSEGFGLVFLEAMAYAKPVIARRAGAASEVIADGTTGILIDQEQELPAAIISILSDPDRADAMGKAGLERLRNIYSFGAFVSSVQAAVDATTR